MSWFAAAQVTGLLLMALANYASAGMWVAIGVGVIALFLHATYLVQRRGAQHMPAQFRSRRAQAVPAHRLALDRWVLAQWIAIAVVGGGGAALLGALGVHPFDGVGLVLDVLAVGWVALWAGIYVSSLVDWFLIMPKVSGVSCPAPCERPGKQRWAGITGLWCFHRGVARLLVPLVVVGCPTVIGAITDSSAGSAVAFAFAASLSVLLIEFEVQGKHSLSFGLNGRRHVGDTLWLVRETPTTVTRQAAWLVDVSAEGAKFKYVDALGRYAGKPFEQKHDDDAAPVGLIDLNARHRVESAEPPCGKACTGVNWYCWNNPLAHSQTAESGS